MTGENIVDAQVSNTASSGEQTAPPAGNERASADRRGTRARDRRQHGIPVALDRREGERRGHTVPQAEEKALEEFAQAMKQYQRDNGRPFPTWSEVLEVLHALGYRKTEPPTPLPRR
jgi:hypothetical protein